MDRQDKMIDTVVLDDRTPFFENTNGIYDVFKLKPLGCVVLRLPCRKRVFQKVQKQNYKRNIECEKHWHGKAQ